MAIRRSAVRLGLAVALAATMLAIFASTAFASEGYANGSVAGESTGAAGQLPFTGAGLVGAAGVAIAVVFTALTLRGYSARRPH